MLDTLHAPVLPESGPGINFVTPPEDVKTEFSDYAGTRAWFWDPQEIRYRNRTYLRFGLTRSFAGLLLPRADTLKIIRIDAHDGVPVYVRPSEVSSATPELLYIPAGPVCWFQPFPLKSRVYINYG